MVGGQNLGSAVTLGSGIPLHVMYQLTKAHGKITVGGTAATVVPSGGYFQGGGHSALSPTFGLLADICLGICPLLLTHCVSFTNAHFQKYLWSLPMVALLQRIALKTLIVRLISYSVPSSNILFIVFWAMRGGGAGSWGVIVSATFQTFPTFDAAISFITISTNTTEQMAQVAKVHAEHIFDLDALRGGQYFYLSALGVFPSSIVSGPLNTGVPTMLLNTYFPNSSLSQAAAALQPFIDDVQKVDGVNLTQQSVLQNINDALTATDDFAGVNLVLGSRLVPASAYKNPTLVGEVYSQLLDAGTIM
jgi:hypothetical protein